MAEPVNPLAGVAGPGPFSARTDLPSSGYGDDVNQIKAAAPLSKSAKVNPMSRSDMGMAPSQLERVTPLYAPSQRQDEDIMTGAPIGPGAGTEVLGMNAIMPRQKRSDVLAKMLPFDETGEIAILLQEAQARGD